MRFQRFAVAGGEYEPVVFLAVQAEHDFRLGLAQARCVDGIEGHVGIDEQQIPKAHLQEPVREHVAGKPDERAAWDNVHRVADARFGAQAAQTEQG